MENSPLFIFDKIWPKTMYDIVQGLWPNFGATLKIYKKNPILIGISSKLLHNIGTCICIRQCNKNGEYSPSNF